MTLPFSPPVRSAKASVALSYDTSTKEIGVELCRPLQTPFSASATPPAKSMVVSLPRPKNVRLAPVALSVMPVSASAKILRISGSVSLRSAM